MSPSSKPSSVNSILNSPFFFSSSSPKSPNRKGEKERERDSIMSHGKSISEDLTLAFIGCGQMGTAILSGILNATAAKASSLTSRASPSPKARPPINRFIASISSENSEKRLTTSLLTTHPDRLEIIRGNNVRAIKRADVILLACKPYAAESILSAESVREALSGKLLISILAGTTTSQLIEWIYGEAEIPSTDGCCIIRAMPNMAASIGKSITMIAIPPTPPPQSFTDITSWIFRKVGDICHIADAQFYAGSALAGATPAFMTVAFDGILDGAVKEGIQRETARMVLAQSFIGAAHLIMNGEHPAVLREKISSPGGTTIMGLLALEKQGVRSAFCDALVASTEKGREMNRLGE